MADRSETVLATPQQLQQALAGAGLLRDDLRGDLKRAADIAAAMCTTAAADQLADAWLGRAIVALQAGDAGLAVRACDRAEAAAGSDATRRLLVAMWRHLAVIAAATDRARRRTGQCNRGAAGCEAEATPRVCG